MIVLELAIKLIGILTFISLAAWLFSDGKPTETEEERSERHRRQFIRKEKAIEYSQRLSFEEENKIRMSVLAQLDEPEEYTPSANEVAEHYYENAIGHMLNIMDDSKQPEEEDDYPNDEPYDGHNDDNYCGACMSDPCMCSDREQTSTIHDF